MSDPLVHADELARVYGEGGARITALAEATFHIDPGDLVSVTGASGSGKSTLLHLIAGLDVPTGGFIDWPALGPRGRLRPGPLTMAFQGPSLLPALTVLENVALPLLLTDVARSSADAQARGMLERLGILDVQEKLPDELSSGQAQRAGLARALVGRPRLVLADEPTGQLDQATGRAVLDEVLSVVVRIGAALIVATHDLQVAARLPDRWSIENGNLRTGAQRCSA